MVVMTVRLDKLTVDEKIRKGESLKNEGNVFFKKQDFKGALKHYHQVGLIEK